MKKEKIKRGRGRPKGSLKKNKKVEIVSNVSKVEDFSPKDFQAPKGIISEDELLGKVQDVRNTGEQLPDEHKTEIDTGTQLEEDLIKEGEQVEAQTDSKGQAAPLLEGDVMAQMANSMLAVPLEEGFSLPEGFLQYSKQEEQLLSQVRPDDLGISKSVTWYWSVFGLIATAKGLKWFFYSRKKKKEEKKKTEAEAKKKQQLEQEISRSDFQQPVKKQNAH